jgi:hypothetical protein
MQFIFNHPFFTLLPTRLTLCCFPWGKWQPILCVDCHQWQGIAVRWTANHDVKCNHCSFRLHWRPEWETQCGQVRLSVATWGNLPYTNSCSPVQLGVNVNDLMDLNGGSPVPLLSRGPLVPLEQPTVFACILSQLWVPRVMCPIPIVVHQSN